MIADYLYNTPSLTTETGAFVLLTQQFANVAALNSALLGKTLAQIRELPSVLGTADTEVKQFGFLQRRNPSSVYAGSTILPNFTVPTSAKFDIVRGGHAEALAMIVMKDGVCLRAVSMGLKLNQAAEVSATRIAFSVDDDFVSVIEGPLGVGFMVGKAVKTLTNYVPSAAPSLISRPTVMTLTVEVPETSPSFVAYPTKDTLTVGVPLPSATLYAYPVTKALIVNVPTKA